MRIVSLCLIISAFLVASCFKVRTFNLDDSITGRYPALFTASSDNIIDHEIRYDFQMRANPEGDTILFALHVKNNSGDTVKFDRSRIQIETSEEIRTDMVWCNSYNLRVAPNSSDTVIFIFLPFNNPVFYDRISYKGDMDSIYYLSLAFIQRNTQSLSDEHIKFSLDENMYRKYQAKYAKEKRIKLFRLNEGGELKQTVSAYTKTLNTKRKKNDDVTVMTSSTDVNIDGSIVRLSFYKIDSDLFLHAKFINHGVNMLKLNLRQFLINADGKSYVPHLESIHNPVFSNDSSGYFVVRGGRLEAELRYDNVPENQFSLLTSGITYPDINEAVFPQSLTFTTESDLY